MKVQRWFQTMITAVALALMGAACGQIDEHDRSVIYDVRDDAVLVVYTDLDVAEEDAVALAKTIRLVDKRIANPADDLRNQLDPNGVFAVEVEPGLIEKIPVPPLRTSGDYEAFQELIRKYAVLEQYGRQLSL